MVALGNCTLAENITTRGGGAFQMLATGAGQLATIKNSLFSANGGDGGNCEFGAGKVTLAGENLSSESSCTGFTLNNADAKLAPLADNGAPTSTYALDPASPAVDAVIDCTDNGGGAAATDQRGHARPQGPACDIGAYELDVDRIFGDSFEAAAP